ncbi:PQQ-binding-like beta-propeller repeat protein [bacterium]|nr:PQQ-binding-like beta-propeller repeat protein [bacterium]
MKQDKSPVYKRESAEPLVKRFRSLDTKTPSAIRALDANTGRVLWEKTGPAGRARPNTLCALGDRAFYSGNQGVTCLDLKTGAEQWTARAPLLRVVSDGAVVCADGKTVQALSAETGKTLWTQEPSLCAIRDVFVIGGAVWLGGFKAFQGRTTGKRGPAWGPYFATQRDLATGKVLKRIEPDNPGHHHRCWSNKATDRYILGGRRGVEFIDLATGEVRWHSWVRGVCRYGVMPANGLLYAPPHACGCYIAAKLDGFHALSASAPAPASATPVLTKGTGYTLLEDRHQVRPTLTDWPTYRRDPARSGATLSPVAATLRPKWRRPVGGRLSSLTVAEGKVFVASVDEHRVVVLDADTGEPRWSFTADARVDSPPTLHKSRALFGSRDGHVYSVRASDGDLVWRLRAAAADRRIPVRGQLESPSPVHGSVLIHQGAACVVAGRSSYLDGGLTLLRIQPQMGSVLSRTPIYSPDPKTGRQPAQTGPSNMPGVLNDILTSSLHEIYLRETVFNSGGAILPKGKPHLLTLTGFLDDTWPHRSYWIFGTRCSISIGCGRQDRNIIAGRLLVHTPTTIYGYGRSKLDWSNALQDAPYRLFALGRADGKRTWTKPVPIHVRAMLLADKVLFAAGPLAAAVDSPGGPAEGPRSFLLALSASDGRELARCPLPAAPIFDGMAATDGRLYLSLESGEVLCMGE